MAYTLPIRISKTWQNDIFAGVMASFGILPKAMALGALLFAPLGTNFVPLGVAAGMFSIIFSNLTIALLGSVPIMNLAPFSLSILMLLSMVQQLVHQPQPLAAEQIVVLSFVTMLLSGLLQLLFAILRVGELAKYIPYPVFSGLLNGSAIVIALSQIQYLFGLEKVESFSLLTLFTNWQEIQIATVIVAVITCISIAWMPKLTQKIPNVLVGNILGMLAYYLIIWSNRDIHIGSVIGEIPSHTPQLSMVKPMFAAIFNPEFSSVWPLVLATAFGLAGINSLRLMITGLTVDFLTQSRSDLNRELFGEGIANMLTACFGGICGTGSTASSLLAYKDGAKTSWSRASVGLFSLCVILFLAPVLALIPKVVLAATLVMISIDSFDLWIVDLFRQSSGKDFFKNFHSLVNILIVIAVAVLLIFFDVFLALGFGIVCSILLFILRMSKQIVRRQYSGDAIRSYTLRNEQEIEELEKNGRQIQVLELEGTLFFGTSDKVAELVDNILRDKPFVEFIILDLKRVSDIESSGARILHQIYIKCKKVNKQMFFTGIKVDLIKEKYPELAYFFKRDELESITFASFEDGLASCEESLLETTFGERRHQSRLPINKIGVLEMLSQEDVNILKEYLELEQYPAGKAVFKQGDRDQILYFIAKGRAKVLVQSLDEQTECFSVLTPGTLFGEMALFDGGCRSASVVAETDLWCYRLTLENLNQITNKHPQLTYKFLLGINKALAQRIRVTNRMLSQVRA